MKNTDTTTTAGGKATLITRQQVAQRLAVSSRTVKRREKEGKLTPVKLSSRCVRYYESEVDNLIAECCVEG